MNPFQEQQAFFKKQWPGMREAAESGGAPAVVEFIAGFEDPMERRVLHVFARQGLVMEDWAGKSLDACVEVARAGIAECLRQAESEEDDEQRTRRTDAANVISYNLSADLAHCWPGDDLERTKEHFEAGLRAAEDCIRWREELDKPAGPRSIAWWAKGAHELALGRASDAARSFETSRDHAREAAEGDATAFGVVLGEGYAAMARAVAGDADAAEAYDRALGAFREQLEDADRKEDAQFGIDQLETMRSRHGHA